MTHVRRSVAQTVLGLSLALMMAGPGARSVAAVDPTPSPGSVGDPRSPGEGPGVVGDPLLAIGGVAVVGLGSVLATLTYVRLAERRRS